MGLLRGTISSVGVVRMQQLCRPKIVHTTHPHIAAPILLNGFKEENLGAILVDGKADGGCNREGGGRHKGHCWGSAQNQPKQPKSQPTLCLSRSLLAVPLYSPSMVGEVLKGNTAMTGIPPRYACVAVGIAVAWAPRKSSPTQPRGGANNTSTRAAIAVETAAQPVIPKESKPPRSRSPP